MEVPNTWKHIVLRFGKALTQRPGLLDKPGESYPLHISLGYFDSLQLYSCSVEEDSTWLSKVYAHDVELSSELDKDFFFHPIHCIASGGESKALSRFMERSTPYLFVTFLQRRTREGETLMENWEQLIQEYLTDNLDPSPAREQEKVSWVLYQSITLSDLVIIWKANSVCAILTAIQKVYYAPMVGDLHSIPSIRCDSILQKEGAPPIQSEPLPQVTIRYLVRNAKAAYEFFTIAGDKRDLPELTIGIEDLTYTTGNWSTHDLRDVIARRLTDSDYMTRFREAFAECEIHLGDHLTSGSEGGKSSALLNERCAVLMERFQELRKNLKERKLVDDLDGPWLKAASELYNALTNLSQNTVADGFCFLVLDAAALFLQKVSQIDRKLVGSRLLRIQRFLRGWGNLMEQVLSTDGKFSQHPIFSPPSLCNIPSNLLEFYLAFTTQASKTMQHSSGNPETFPLLLEPKLCRRIKVESVFAEMPPCDRILHVDIPISVLYDPITVLCHLIHEISHFAGDGWRLRQLRAEKYFSICAQELAGEFLFQQSSTVKAIRQSLPQIPFDFPIYLENLPDVMRRHLTSLLNEQETLVSWLNSECYTDGISRRVNQLKSNLRIQTLKSDLQSHPNGPVGPFFRIMEDFDSLFRECYADISAIFILGLTSKEYLGLASQELKLYWRTYEEKGSTYYLNVERWATVLFTLFPTKIQFLPKTENFIEDIHQCVNFLYIHTPFASEDLDLLQDHYHKPESMEQLLDYLRMCHATMEDFQNQQQGELDNLRRAFRTLINGNDVSAAPCRSIVSQYRRTLLDQ